MAKRLEDNLLDIPGECFKVKAWYLERPSKELVREIKAFVAMTGLPHLWSGHTHTKPLPDDIPIYLDEFELPATLIKSGRLAPCPCCTPRHPKYGKGKIAWFPKESVIRLLGPDCFATVNKDAHEAAVAEMRIRKQREADIAYLLKHQDRLRKAYRVISDAIQVAKAIDRFSDDLRYAIRERMNFVIWDRVRQGELAV